VFSLVAACVADIVFLIDNSASIRHNELRGVNNWQLILDFVKSIIDAFVIGPQDTRVAVIDFGLSLNVQRTNDDHNYSRQNVLSLKRVMLANSVNINGIVR